MHPQTKITDEQLIAELQSGTTAKEIAKKYGLSLRNVYMRKARLSKKGIGHGNDAVIRKRVADGFGVKRVSALVRGNGEEVMSWVITEQDKERQLEAMRAVVEGMNSEITPAAAIGMSISERIEILSQIRYTEGAIGEVESMLTRYYGRPV